jgi:hypothetical protein
MALRWIEGWETHTGTAQLGRKYATQTGSIVVQSGRVFGNSAGVLSLVAVTPSFGLQDTLVLGIGVRLSSQQAGLNSNAQGFYFERGGLEQAHVEFVSNAGSFEFAIKRAGTTIFTTSSAFAYGVWHYFEFKLTLDTTTGAYEIRQNESTIASGSSVNLANTGSDQADGFAIRFTSNVSTSLFLDDIYVLDTTDSVNNDFKGDSVVEGILPNANGATIQWTNLGGSASNFQNVDDAATTPTDGTNANSGDTLGEKDLYALGDLTQITGDVHGVQVGVQLALDTAGTRDVDVRFRDQTTSEAVIDTHTVASTTYDEFTTILDENPVTTNPWSISDIDNGQFGVEVAS